MSDTTNYLKDFIKTLNNLDNFSVMQMYYQGVLDDGTADEQIDFATFLSEFLSKEGAVIQKQNPKMYDAYQRMWYSLVISGFISLSPEDQQGLLMQKVGYAAQNDINLDLILRQYYRQKYAQEDIEIITRTFAKFLEQNTETLGTNPITVQGRRFLPAIKYWIMDYASFPSKNAKRGSIDRLNYINQSINTRPLTQVQKQQLLKILKLYDEFLNPEPPIMEKQKGKLEGVSTQAISSTVDIDQKLQELRSRKQ